MKCLSTLERREGKLFPYYYQTVNFIVQKYEEYSQFMRSSYEPDSFLSYNIFAGVLIGHEPGLGKTVISCVTLSHLFKQRRMRYALVICPKSVVFYWKSHLLDWCPSVSHMIIEGTYKEKKQLLSRVKDYSQLVVVISWPNIVLYLEQLLDIHPSIIIADESTEVKNTQTAVFMALKRFGSQSFKVALSGTPIMNNLVELYAVVDCVCPGYFGYEKDFKRYYVDKMQVYRVSQNSEDQSRLYILQHRIARELEHMMLRFTKNSIADYIGQKEEIIVWLYLAQEYEAAYYQCIEYYANKQITPFYAVGKLKQIAEAAGKTSSKIDVCIELLRHFAALGLKTLVFVDFLETLEFLRYYLAAKLNVPVFVITGQTVAKERSAIVERFYSQKYFQVMLLTTKIGSFGLNLQLAQRIILLSPHWNPQVEQYAIGRAWRLGNQEEVKVYKLCCRQCIDEKIVYRYLFKRELVNVIGGNEVFDFGDNVFEVFDRKSTGVEIPCEGGDAGLEALIAKAVPSVEARFGQILASNEIIEKCHQQDADTLGGIPSIEKLRSIRKCDAPDPSQVITDLADIFGDLYTTQQSEELTQQTPYYEISDELDNMFNYLIPDYNQGDDELTTEYRLQALLDEKFV